MRNNISNDFLIDGINEWNKQIVMMYGNPSTYLVGKKDVPDIATTVRAALDDGHSKKEAMSIGLCIVISDRITDEGFYNCPIETLILILTMLTMFDTKAFDGSEQVKQQLRQHDENYAKQKLTEAFLG